MHSLQDRGDDGAIPDPSWTEHWSTWSPKAMQSRIAEAASYGILSPVQVEALLQGMPPPPRGADPTGTLLAEFEAVVHRYRQDAARGRISTTPTPQELAAWADAMAAELPDPFLNALKAQTIKVGAARVGVAPGGHTVTLPPWAAPLPASDVEMRPKPKRKVGRPTTLKAVVPALEKAAWDNIMAAARKGRRLSLMAAAQQLQGTPVAGGAVREHDKAAPGREAGRREGQTDCGRSECAEAVAVTVPLDTVRSGA